MLDLGSGLGTHMHSGTPTAAVEVSEDAFGSISKGVYRPFLPTGAAPARGVAPSVSIATVSVLCSVAPTHSAVLLTLQPGGIMAPSASSNTMPANSADESLRFNNSRNASVCVKEPSVKMPSFDARTGNWISFIQDFEDMVTEMNWEGIELSKLKVCLEGKAKQVYRSFDDSTKNSYVAVRDQFTALYGDIDERGAATARLFHIKKSADQDLNSFVSDITVLANRAFPTDKDSAQVQAKEDFLKGCVHQSETDFVFKIDKCTTLKEAVSEVKRLVETASNTKAVMVCASSPSRPDRFRATRRRLVIFLRDDGMMVSRLIEGIHRNFSPDRWNFSHESKHCNFSPNRGRWDFSPQGLRDLSSKQSRSNFLSSRNYLSGSYNYYRSPPCSPSRGYSANRRPSGPCFRCGQLGQFLHECSLPPSPGRAYQDSDWRSPSSSPKTVRFADCNIDQPKL